MKYSLQLSASLLLFVLSFRGIAQNHKQRHEEIIRSVPTFFSGDINGDGINDVIYTVVLSSPKSFRQFIAKVFYGTREGLSTQPAWTFTSGDTIQDLRTLNFDFDVNNDGVNDLLAIADVKLPESRSLIAAIIVVYNSKEGFTDQRPTILTKMDVTRHHKEIFCDYNKDGHADVIVQSWSQPPSYGHIERTKFKNQIMYGSAKGFSGLEDINLDIEGAPVDISTGFDYDGDKVRDMVLGSSGRTTYFDLFSTKRNKIDTWLTIHYPLFRLWTYDFHGVGDINGDGYNDGAILRNSSGGRENMLTIFRGCADSLTTDTLLSYSFHEWKSYNLFLSTLGDFDGNGSRDMFIGNDAFFGGPILEGDTVILDAFGPLRSSDYKHVLKNLLIWGGNPLSVDSSGNAKFSEFVQSHALRIQSIGDINGDKKDDLLLYNGGKQFIIYGNKERKFDPVEWIHK